MRGTATTTTTTTTARTTTTTRDNNDHATNIASYISIFVTSTCTGKGTNSGEIRRMTTTYLYMYITWMMPMWSTSCGMSLTQGYYSPTNRPVLSALLNTPIASSDEHSRFSRCCCCGCCSSTAPGERGGGRRGDLAPVVDSYRSSSGGGPLASIPCRIAHAEDRVLRFTPSAWKAVNYSVWQGLWRYLVGLSNSISGSNLGSRAAL